MGEWRCVCFGLHCPDVREMVYHGCLVTDEGDSAAVLLASSISMLRNTQLLLHRAVV